MDNDKLIQEMYIKDPLMKFSLYTGCQIQHLRLMKDLIQKLDNEKTEEGLLIKSSAHEHFAYFWFWVLGAYEVIRTISQHKECFVETKHSGIDKTKKDIAVLRMPFAKQELKGEDKGAPSKPTRFYAENSATSFDCDKGFCFEVKGKLYWSIEFTQKVQAFFDGFVAEDIRSEMPMAEREASKS